MVEEGHRTQDRLDIGHPDGLASLPSRGPRRELLWWDNTILAVPLPGGLFAFVDEASRPLVAPFSWSVSVSRGLGYVRSRVKIAGRYQNISLHRLLMGFPSDTVDHIDGDPKNCLTSNMRVVSHQENCCNRDYTKHGSSGYHGVKKLASGRWAAVVKTCGKSTFGGAYNDPVQAARVRDKLALQLLGPCARLNFPLTEEAA